MSDCYCLSAFDVPPESRTNDDNRTREEGVHWLQRCRMSLSCPLSPFLTALRCAIGFPHEQVNYEGLILLHMNMIRYLVAKLDNFALGQGLPIQKLCHPRINAVYGGLLQVARHLLKETREKRCWKRITKYLEALQIRK